LTGSATLLAGTSKDFRFYPFVTSENFQEEYKENPLPVSNSKTGRKQHAHPFDKGCVESREETNPCKLAIVVAGSWENIGNKMLAVDKLARSEEIEDVEDRMVCILRSRGRI
jgi:hypothetical protein